MLWPTDNGYFNLVWRAVRGEPEPTRGTMRYYCHFCHRPVTSEVPGDTIVRAILICPECINAQKVVFPHDEPHNPPGDA